MGKLLKSKTKSPNKVYTVALFGSAGCGKTSIARFFCSAKKPVAQSFIMRKHEESYTKELYIAGFDSTLTLKIVEVPHDNHLLAVNLHNIDVAIIVFDITSKDSEREVDAYLEKLAEAKEMPTVFAIIGNKADLIPKLNLAHNEMKNRWKAYVEEFFFTSAVTGANINELFAKIGRVLKVAELQEEKRSQKLIHALVMGDRDAGKTSVIERFTLKSFSGAKEELKESIIAEVPYDAALKYSMKFKLIETQEKNNLANFKNCINIFVIVYDLTVFDSIKNVKNCISKAKSLAPSAHLILILGNKADLIHSPCFNNHQVQLLAEAEECIHKVVSAKNGFGINSAFKELATQVVERGLPRCKGNLSDKESCSTF